MCKMQSLQHADSGVSQISSMQSELLLRCSSKNCQIHDAMEFLNHISLVFKASISITYFKKGVSHRPT